MLSKHAHTRFNGFQACFELELFAGEPMSYIRPLVAGINQFLIRRKRPTQVLYGK
jgi:hypothetical protein